MMSSVARLIYGFYTLDAVTLSSLAKKPLEGYSNTKDLESPTEPGKNKRFGLCAAAVVARWCQRAAFHGSYVNAVLGIGLNPGHFYRYRTGIGE